MCRFVSAHGRLTEENLSYVTELFYSLRSSAEYDRYSPSADKTHGDGWGFSIFSESGVSHYKTIRPIWADFSGNELFLSCLRKSLGKRVSLIVHARKASPNTPREILDSHPFVFRLADGALLSFAHNGSLDISGTEYNTSSGTLTRSDSYVFARLYLSKSSLSTIISKIAEAIRGNMVKTALNSAISLKYGDRIATLVLNYYVGDRSEYYDIYRTNIEGIEIAGSSTSIEYFLENMRKSRGSSLSHKLLGNGRLMICADSCDVLDIDKLDSMHYNPMGLQIQ